MIDLEKERKLFQDFLTENYDFENHEQTYFDEKTQCYVNDCGEDTEHLNIAWETYKKCAESKQAEIDSLKAQLSEYSKAALDVIGERNRQIEQEYYSIEHDDSYQNNELPRAAASYLNNVVSRGWVFNSVYGPEAYQSEEVPDLWPWSDEHWKPKNPRRDLVKAAALIIAEIDRMDRSSAGEQS